MGNQEVGMNANKPLFIRRVVGKSMSPMLMPDKLIFASSMFRYVMPGQVVIVEHEGKQKVKRIERIENDKIFVIGDNLEASTDSRHFGWLEPHQIIAIVVWPRLRK